MLQALHAEWQKARRRHDLVLCLTFAVILYSGWAAPRPPGRMNWPTPTAPCFTACPSSIPFCCRC